MNEQNNNEQENDNENEIATETAQTTEEPVVHHDVVIKKSGWALLALLLAVAALALAGHQYWQSLNTVEKPSKDWSQDIEWLTDEQANLHKNISEKQSQIDALKNQIEQLPQGGAEPTVSVDHQPQIDQLVQQLNQQEQTIKQLKQLIQNQPQTTAPNKEVLPQATFPDDRRWAIDVLYGCRLLLNQGQVPQAISSLQSFLNQANLTSTHRQSLTALLRSWQQTQTIDRKALQQQLNQISQQVREMTLPTTKPAEQTNDQAWYSKFISVKKIEQNDRLADSHDLLLLKAAITDHLQQAGWALTLKQQEAWLQHLKQADALLPDYESSIKQALMPLIQTDIASKRTDLTSLDEAIATLKGER